MKSDDLKAAIGQLSYRELVEFKYWFDEHFADAWDRQIEADILAGRLDELGRQADEDRQAGRCTPL